MPAIGGERFSRPAVASLWLAAEQDRCANAEHVIRRFASPDEAYLVNLKAHGCPRRLKFLDEPAHFLLALDLPDAKVRLDLFRGGHRIGRSKRAAGGISASPLDVGSLSPSRRRC